MTTALKLLDGGKKREPIPCLEDDGYANEDDYVDRMGRYYSSEYVKANQSWVQGLPFEEWLARRMRT